MKYKVIIWAIMLFNILSLTSVRAENLENSSIDKQKVNMFFELGYIYYMQKDYQKALKVFSDLEEEINPEKNYPPDILDMNDVTKEVSNKEAANYYLYYAICHEMVGNKEKAHLYYTEANKYFKRYPDELFLKGKETFSKNDFLHAIELFETSLKERPQNMEAYYYIAKCYFAVSDMEKAEKTADLIILKNMTDLNPIYAFKSAIKQSDSNYKAAALIESKLKKDFRRNVILVCFVIMLLACISITYYAMKGKKITYSNALEEIYADIERMRSDKILYNESRTETGGLEF